MRVFTFSIIALGIMFFLLIGGVETNSSLIIQGVGGNGSSFWSNTTLWLAVILAMGAFVLTNRVAVGGFSFQASRESVIAGFAMAIYIMFMSDIYSIATKVYSLKCVAGTTLISCGSWEYQVIMALVLMMGLGYGISLIQFIGGTD